MPINTKSISKTSFIYASIKASDIAMFRFLLEARENIAQFTVLDKKKALIKIFYPAENYNILQKNLYEIGTEITIFWEKHQS